MTAVEVGTAVLGRPAPRRGPAAPVSRSAPVLDRALPSTALFAVAAVLLGTGTLPVADGELVLAGLAAAFLGTLVARLVTRPAAAGDVAVVVPLVHLGAAGLLWAGTASPGVLFLALAPVLTLVAGPGRRGVLARRRWARPRVLLLPGLLASSTSPAGSLGVPLLLGPLAVGLGGLGVNETARRIGGQAARIERLEDERALLLAQVQTRADELDLATRMLAARAQTMTSVIDAVTEQSIIGTDRDGIIRVWNPGAEKMLGLPRPEVVRKRSILEFHLPEELESRRRGRRYGHRARRARARGPGARQRRPRLDLRGRRRRSSAPSRSRSRRAPTTSGAHAGWNFVGTDMTEARATERMKDQFVSLISHELRTPLTSILGYLELVLEDEEQPLTDEQRSYLTTVERNADRLLRLVGDLLFTAQVDAGRFTLKPEDVDLAAVVRAAEESVRVTAAAAGVEIVVDVPAEAARRPRRRRPAGPGVRQPRLQRRQVHARPAAG